MTSSVSTIHRPSKLVSLPAITVSGFLGSGAGDIAFGVARELDVACVDGQIVRDTARQLGVNVDAVERRGEGGGWIGARIDSALRALIDALAAADTVFFPATSAPVYPLGEPGGDGAGIGSLGAGRLDDRRYLAALTSVITAIAAPGNVVILGHGSESILQDQPNALRVYVYASPEHRINTLMRREGVSEREAERLVSKNYQHQRAFTQHFFAADFASPSLYDFVVQAERLSFDLAVQSIVVAARARAQRRG